MIKLLSPGLAVLFSGILCFSVASCGNGNGPGPDDGEEADLIDVDGIEGEDSLPDENDIPVEGECPEERVCGAECCEAGDRCMDGACCPEEKYCGDTCCPEGEVCMGGLCRLGCTSGIRCLTTGGVELCCEDDTLCFMGGCVTPGSDCVSDADCEPGQYCEAAAGKCLPFPSSACAYVPPAGVYDPAVEWWWPPEEGTAIMPDHVDVLAPPAIGDMDGDGVPEVAFVAYDDNCSGDAAKADGLLTILRGDTGQEVLRLDDPEKRLGAAPATAMGDVDGDGLAEVVVMTASWTLAAYELDGTLLWESDDTVKQGGLNNVQQFWGGGIAIADLDNFDLPEVFFGAMVFDGRGHFLWAGEAGQGVMSGRVYLAAALSTAADLDGDDDLELIGGRTAYQHNADVYWTSTVGDGYPAVADFFVEETGEPGKDGKPEVAIVTGGSLYILNGQTGETVWGRQGIPGTNYGGPPVVADFDGDTLAEIGVAGRSEIFVFNPDGEEAIAWRQPIDDAASEMTGSTAFDFEGDGAAELVCFDECFVRIYSGSDGTELHKISNNAFTANEYPLVVDVDGDGETELIVTSNPCTSRCTRYEDWDGPVRSGVRAYGDTLRNWVRTKKVWNQHTYHVTNVSANATIPAPEAANWETDGLNNFRQNKQTWGVNNTPDMRVEMFGGDSRWCGGGVIFLGVMVTNRGSWTADAGVNVTFYEVMADDSRTLLGTAQTLEPLLPGMSEYVQLEWTIPAEEIGLDVYRFVVIVDDPAAGETVFHECDEDNNEAGPVDVRCNT